MPRNYWSTWNINEGKVELPEKEKLMNGLLRSKIFQNDSTGEQIYISFFKSSRYFQPADSTISNALYRFTPGDSTMLLVKELNSKVDPGYFLNESIFTDTNSSRRFWSRTWYRPESGIRYIMLTLIDSISKPSAFLTRFFESFQPAADGNVNETKINRASLYFNDFNSPDSVLHQRAIRNIDEVSLDSAHLPDLAKAIYSLNWKEKKYLDLKTSFINKLGVIKTNRSADILERLYFDAGDTLQLQYSALENLLQLKDQYAYNLFRKVMMNDPPVLEQNHTWSPLVTEMDDLPSKFDNGSFLDELFDSLALTKIILPDLLPLLNLKDYQVPLMWLLKNMLDSGLIGGKDYEDYFSKFFIEAKQELKKQSIAEKKRSIDKAVSEQEGNTDNYTTDGKENGNDLLSLYTTLLLPFESRNTGINSFIQQLLRSHDRRLVLNTALLMLKNRRIVPDSIIKSLAGTDDFRFELYSRLKDIQRLDFFPLNERNQAGLARSALIFQKLYDNPDTIAYLDKRFLTTKNQSGYIFFFKYKMKMVDLNWKIATVGLIPADSTSFNTDVNDEVDGIGKKLPLTGFRSVRLKEDKPLSAQLDTIIQRWMVEQRKSGKEFYAAEDDDEVEEE